MVPTAYRNALAVLVLPSYQDGLRHVTHVPTKNWKKQTFVDATTSKTQLNVVDAINILLASCQF